MMEKIIEITGGKIIVAYGELLQCIQNALKN
jgi:hypothetical protein